jgi:indolepyruvate ferredoxin oxidoreductase
VTADVEHRPVRKILSGTDTLAQLLLLRHRLDERDGLTTATMVSGYPGSPLGGFDLTLDALGSDVLAGHRIVHRPGLNEELAAAIVWGSQMGAVIPYDGVDGVAGAWYGKGPGLDRCGDALKHANAMGAGPNGGAVMFCGDDPGSKSSTLACDSQYTFEDACVPVLFPGDQQDVLDLGAHAFRLSRYCGAWAGLKIVTSVADGIGTVDLDLARHAFAEPADLVIDGRRWRHRPLATVGPHAVPDQEALVMVGRLRAAKAYARANGLDRVIGGPSGQVGVICAGKTYFDVLEAFATLGVGVDDLADAGVRVLKLGLTYPLVEETVTEFAASVDELIVIEEKRPFIETQLRAILHEAGSRVPVVGKRDRTGDHLTPSVGELDSDTVARILTRTVPALARRPQTRMTHHSQAHHSQAQHPQAHHSQTRQSLPPHAPIPSLPLLPLVEPPARAPGFCSGCPHNRSTVVPDGALVGGGVGCHGIMYFEARHAGMKSLPPPPMGAEGVPWLGLSPFVAEPHVIQNLGDGTFSHSGTLAIRASVAAGADITFKILYNATVAMTGGQDVTGLMDVPAMTRALEAEGVRKIVVCAEEPDRYGRRARWAAGTRVLGRDRLPEVQESLRRVPGVTVIIYDQRCAAQSRRLRKRGQLADPPRRVFINEAVCEGCGDCGAKSNCLSVLPVATEFGEKRQIHDPSCNRDYTCLDGDCPSFVTITPKPTRSRQPAKPQPPHSTLPGGSLPIPEPAASGRRYGIYFTGIGGTGVVTANRILAAAAERAGFAIGGLDQTGLSQKAGAVVSHLHLARSRDDLGAATVGADGADLYLSGDILQAAAARHLAKIRTGATIAVVDPDVTPTSAMLQTDQSAQGHSAPPQASLRQAIEARAGADRVVFVEAKRIAEAVFSDHLLANVILLGAAFQSGGLPLTLDDVAAALGRQGRAAARNRAAFEWGRWAVHDPSAVSAAVAGPDADRSPGGAFAPTAPALATAAGLVEALVKARTLPPALQDLVTRRAAQIIDYQDPRLARRFLDLVGRAAADDDEDRGWALTEAVAESWFKLLTYKDEYEVARLHLAADYAQAARGLGIEGPYTVTYHLHPPILRRLGMASKLALGKPYELAFRLLRPMKRLRGTPLDVFGWDRDRRTERAVIAEYEVLLADALASGLPYDDLVRLAASAQSVKGYGPVKEAAVTAWRARTAELRHPSISLSKDDPPHRDNSKKWAAVAREGAAPPRRRRVQPDVVIESSVMPAARRAASRRFCGSIV